MASVHNIAVTMTADAKGAVKEFHKIQREINSLEKIQKTLVSQGYNTAATALNGEIRALKGKQTALAKQHGFISGVTKKTVENTRAEKQNTIAIKANTVAKTANAKSSVTMARSTGRMNVAIAQAGFAVEDFMTQVGPAGLAGGLRAAGNNISLMASMLGGPLIGAVIGITTAALPTLVNMLTRTSEEADEANRSLTNLNKAADKWGDGWFARTRKVLDMQDELNKAHTGDEASKWHKTVQDDLQNTQKEASHTKREIEQLMDFQLGQMERRGISRPMGELVQKNMLAQAARGVTPDMEEAFEEAKKTMPLIEAREENFKRFYSAKKEDNDALTKAMEKEFSLKQQIGNLERAEITAAEKRNELIKREGEIRRREMADLMEMREEQGELEAQQEAKKEELKNSSKAPTAKGQYGTQDAFAGRMMNYIMTENMKAQQDVKREALLTELREIKEELADNAELQLEIIE
jgi:hypothetical protein